MKLGQGLLVANATVTLLLVGVILTIQWVHYPLFEMVRPDDFARFAQAHAERITVVVAPLMMLEAMLAIALSLLAPAGAPRWLAFTGLALVAVIWLSTFIVQVPLHEVLRRGWNVDAHARLVDSNWIRTCAWTLRGGLGVGGLLWANRERRV